MPIRAIRQLQGKPMTWALPTAIKNSYVTWGDNTFELLIGRHFGKDGKLIRAINEKTILGFNSDDREQRYDLAHHPIIRRFGVIAGEYLEITFLHKVDNKSHKPLEPIFPEREIVESDLPDDTGGTSVG